MMFTENRLIFDVAPSAPLGPEVPPPEVTPGPAEGPGEIVSADEMVEAVNVEPLLAIMTEAIMTVREDVFGDLQEILENPDIPEEEKEAIRAMGAELEAGFAQLFESYEAEIRANAERIEKATDEVLQELFQLSGVQFQMTPQGIMAADVAGVGVEQYKETPAELLQFLETVAYGFSHRAPRNEVDHILYFQKELRATIDEHPTWSGSNPLDEETISRIFEHYTSKEFISAPTYLAAPRAVQSAYQHYLVGELDYNIRIQDKMDGFWGDKATLNDIDYWFGKKQASADFRPAYSSSDRETLGIGPDREPDSRTKKDKEIFAVTQILDFETWHKIQFKEKSGVSPRLMKDQLHRAVIAIDKNLARFDEAMDAQLVALGQDLSDIEGGKTILGQINTALKEKDTPDHCMYYTEIPELTQLADTAAEINEEIELLYKEKLEALLVNATDSFAMLPEDHEFLIQRDELIAQLNEGKLPISEVVNLVRATDIRVAEIEVARAAAETEAAMADERPDIPPEATEPFHGDHARERRRERPEVTPDDEDGITFEAPEYEDEEPHEDEPGKEEPKKKKPETTEAESPPPQKGTVEIEPKPEVEPEPKSKPLEAPDEASIRTEKQKLMEAIRANARPRLRMNEFDFFLGVPLGDANAFERALSPDYTMRQLRPDQRAKLKRTAIGEHFGDSVGRATMDEANRYIGTTRYLNRQIVRMQQRGVTFKRGLEDLSVNNVLDIMAHVNYYAKNAPETPGEYHTKTLLLEQPGGRYAENTDSAYQFKYRNTA